MRKTFSPQVEAHRITQGHFASKPGWQYGAFTFHPYRGPRTELRVIVSAADYGIADGWEHASVSTQTRCPTWEEMCFVKDCFWEPEEDVLQFHPRQSAYVNVHPFCLHLWKPPYSVVLPPKRLIG